MSQKKEEEKLPKPVRTLIKKETSGHLMTQRTQITLCGVTQQQSRQLQAAAENGGQTWHSGMELQVVIAVMSFTTHSTSKCGRRLWLAWPPGGFFYEQ